MRKYQWTRIQKQSELYRNETRKNHVGGEFTRGQFIGGGNWPGGNSPGDNLPGGGIWPGGNSPEGNLQGGSDLIGGNWPGEIDRGGIFRIPFSSIAIIYIIFHFPIFLFVMFTSSFKSHVCVFSFCIDIFSKNYHEYLKEKM